MARMDARQILDALGRPKPPAGMSLQEWDIMVDRMLKVFRNYLDAKRMLQDEMFALELKVGDRDFVDDLIYGFHDPSIYEVTRINFYNKDYERELKVFADLWTRVYYGQV